ncbi:hypothetical protein GCM10022200_11570 [Microbacterium awajiense]|uniref:ADP-dependent (S)-NAD(P)H-hydrate dehydratase n=1 Tax=Microbacterium awajiense TaxID=415214 RepID=A0ABP7AEG6_9MICO
MAGVWTVADAAGVLRVPTSADHKYSRGVLGVRTGSDRYPGAAVLGVEAAWRTGLGMVRYLGPARATDLVLAARPETVVAAGRVQAWLIGSGTSAADRSDADASALRDVLAGDVPVVVDAGALDLVPGARASVIVTPHDREHVVLRQVLGLPEPGGDRVAAAAETARALGGVVVLKGAVTVVVDADGWSTIVDAGTPWLATAGTGDVLGGAVGAVIAASADRTFPLAAAAATAVWLHARAASVAAHSLGPRGGPITALDVAGLLPVAVAEALAAQG